MKSDEYISIILFVSDSIPQLEKCLCHILDYTPSQQCELIVVETKECAELHGYVSALPNITLLPYERDMSAGARYKSAVDLATGTYIVFLHDFVLPGYGWLVELSRKKLEVKDCVIVQPFQEEHDDVCEDALNIYPGCFFINRQVLLSLGSFSACYYTEYYCLAELAFRVLADGGRIVNVGACRVECCMHYDNENMKFFSQDGKQYKLRNGFDWAYSTYVRENMLDLLDYKKPGVSILDIGCACGANFVAIKNNNQSVALYGLELCEPAAKVAGNFANVQVTDFEKFENDDFNSKFDYVIMGDVLEHLFYTDKALQKVWHWLKPGGRLVVSVPNVAHISVILAVLQGQWNYAESGILDNTHVRFFTRRTILACLEKNGFAVKEQYMTCINYASDTSEVHFMKQLLHLPGLKVEKDDLNAYQVVCLAEKVKC